MLSQIHGAIFVRFGTIKQSVNGRKKSKSRRETSGPLSPRNGLMTRKRFQRIAMTVSGMKNPVFFNQNETAFSSPWSQPNCHSKNLLALTALLWVDHHICGSATSEATMKKTSHGRKCADGRSRQRLKAKPSAITNDPTTMNVAGGL